MGEQNPRVFMDISINMVHAGRMIFELFKEDAPATVENFRALCPGEKGIGPTTEMPLHYKKSFFYEIWKRYSYIKGGDFNSSLGTCGESIYGADFPEKFWMRGQNVSVMNGDFCAWISVIALVSALILL